MGLKLRQCYEPFQFSETVLTMTMNSGYIFCVVTLAKISIAMDFSILNVLLEELNPSNLIYIDNRDTDTKWSLVESSHIIGTQALSGSLSTARNVVQGPLEARTIVVVVLENPEDISDIMINSKQSDLIYSTWVIIGSGKTLISETLLKLQASKTFHGFSPTIQMVYLDCSINDCNVTQIVGNGLRPPILKVRFKQKQNS